MIIKNNIRKYLPQIAIMIVVIAIFVTNISLKKYNEKRGIIYYDVLEYYTYLPATFINKDLKLEKCKDMSDKFWPLRAPNGGNVAKMFMGMSVMYSPFFFIAHAITPFTHYHPDGFSMPYQFMIQFSCLFYLMIGLFLLQKTLREYFSPEITALTIIIMTLGTNLFYYASVEAAMSHAYSFSLFCIFIRQVMKWHNKPTFLTTAGIGLLYGLITLIRPTNGIVILIFLFWKIKKSDDLINQYFFFYKNIYKIALIILFTFLIWVPQFCYWKYVTNQWIYYPYSNNEHFFFSDPQIIRSFFSFRKGWLLYTPLMGLSILGLPFLHKQMRALFWPIFIFFIVNVYIITSWWVWWYGGSFSQRPLIDSYSVLSFPIAAILSWIYFTSPQP
jgi:hypothetical protein